MQPQYAGHLYTFDLETRSERLLTNLDDNGSEPRVVPYFSVSPDRRWIAFGARDFRFTPADRTNGYEGGIIWAVGVDGKVFSRLTPPTDKVTKPGDLLQTWKVVDYRRPLWSQNPDTIYFEEISSVTCSGVITDPTSCNYSRVRAIQSARSGQVDSGRSPLSGCISSAPVAIRPGGATILVNGSSCRSTVPNEGLGEFTFGTDTAPEQKRRIPIPKIGEYFDPIHAAYLPDGSILIVAAGNVRKVRPNPEGLARRYRQGIYLWSEAAGTRALFEPPTDDVDIADIAVTGSGKVIVQQIRNGEAREESQLFLFDPGTGQLGEQLTRAEDNIRPRW